METPVSLGSCLSLQGWAGLTWGAWDASAHEGVMDRTYNSSPHSTCPTGCLNSSPPATPPKITPMETPPEMPWKVIRAPSCLCGNGAGGFLPSLGDEKLHLEGGGAGPGWDAGRGG